MSAFVEPRFVPQRYKSVQVLHKPYIVHLHPYPQSSLSVSSFAFSSAAFLIAAALRLNHPRIWLWESQSGCPSSPSIPLKSCRISFAAFLSRIRSPPLAPLRNFFSSHTTCSLVNFRFSCIHKQKGRCGVGQ